MPTPDYPYSIKEKPVVSKLPIGCFLSQEDFFATLSQLVLFSVDRYIAVKHSLRYQSLVTKQRILIAELLAWAFKMVVTIPETSLAFIKGETKLSVQVGHTLMIIISMFTLMS